MRRCPTYLRLGIELDHGVSEGVGIGTQVRHQAEHGAVEGAIDLLQRQGAGVVHIDDGNVAKESEGRVRRGIGNEGNILNKGGRCS